MYCKSEHSHVSRLERLERTQTFWTKIIRVAYEESLGKFSLNMDISLLFFGQ